METTYTVVTSDFVNVIISTSSSTAALAIEKRFRKDITVADLKGKLEMLTAGNPLTLKIELYDAKDNLICPIDNDAALLGSYPVEDGMRIHVVDKFLLRSQLTESADFEKYEMPLEEYAKRPDTVRAFLEKNRLGKFNEEEVKKKEEERLLEEAADEAAAKAVTVGDRCEVSVPGNATRRGSVQFVGLTEFQKGWWVGVKYDEPVGKNDGSAKGKRYFTCPDKYGGFVKPAYVKVGDFPEEEFELDEI